MKSIGCINATLFKRGANKKLTQNLKVPYYPTRILNLVESDDKGERLAYLLQDSIPCISNFFSELILMLPWITCQDCW